MEEGEHRSACKLGRPRSEAARQAILRAAHDLLARDGFAGVTMEAIASEAGVSKATLYRWWPCKATVVMDAFLAATSPCAPCPDTGSVREDLRRHLHGLVRAFAGQSGSMMADILADAQADPHAAIAFRTHYLDPRHEEAKTVLARGQARGEICPNADLDTILDAFYGPLYFRLLTRHAPLSPEFADALLSLVLDGVHSKSRQ